jgi:hypothetical protein
VVSGKQAERFPDQPPLGIFDLTPYGLPVMLAGIIYVVLLGPKLLPGDVKTKRKPCAAVETGPVVPDPRSAVKSLVAHFRIPALYS